jgi:hypothetical protein
MENGYICQTYERKLREMQRPCYIQVARWFAIKQTALELHLPLEAVERAIKEEFLYTISKTPEQTVNK